LKQFAVVRLDAMILISLFTISLISLSITNSAAFPQEHANKAYSSIPFEFPMPLGNLSSDFIHSKSNQNDHIKGHSLSYTNSIRENSILKATDNKIIKKTKVNSSKNSSMRISSANPNTLTSKTRDRSISNRQFMSQGYPIIYHITGSGNKLKNISVQKDNTILLVNIWSQTSGTLTIELPRISSNTLTNKQGTFTVFEDSRYYTALGEKDTNNLRQLTIHFDRGTRQIEILASHTSPEFGMITVAFALIIVLIISPFRMCCPMIFNN
jgi:hypothetical protein